MQTQRSQAGAVVLEALISILIFSIGILAIIGLQAASIQDAAAAKYRTDASLLANRIIGEMWVSDKTALATNFASPDGAAYKIWAASAVAPTLPGVSGDVNAPSIAISGTNVTVTVKWQAPNDTQSHAYTATAVITE